MSERGLNPKDCEAGVSGALRRVYEGRVVLPPESLARLDRLARMRNRTPAQRLADAWAGMVAGWRGDE